MDIILASASPRRRELLKFITENFTVQVTDADETVSGRLTPEETVKAIAEIKADALNASQNELIIASDTVVSIDGLILGKPNGRDEAFTMLKRLSGRTHEVYTGVCVKTASEKNVFTEKTEVEFYPLSDEETEAYINTGEPFDKAGAYGIQGKGSFLVKRINGDFYNVMGLPVAKLYRAIKKYL